MDQFDRAATSNGGDIGLYQCLIVSADESQRQLLSLAATEAGWLVCMCPDARTALDRVRRMYLHLAIVDLDQHELARPAGFGPLVEELARASNLLLVVCGREGSAQEEIWARQLGVWLYLPGTVDREDLTALCGEARQLVGRLSARDRPVGRLA
jgi:DNA-binding response OmpR family regulator